MANNLRILDRYMINTISSVQVLKLPYFLDEMGDLVVLEGMGHSPFGIARVFTIRAPEGFIRGRHAHKLCAQFLNSPCGSVEVFCNDGSNEAVFELNHPNIGLYIPPGIWAEQTYKTADALLMVLCDRIYEPDDYIRDYSDFLKYRQELLGRTEPTGGRSL